MLYSTALCINRHHYVAKRQQDSKPKGMIHCYVTTAYISEFVARSIWLCSPLGCEMLLCIFLMKSWPVAAALLYCHIFISGIGSLGLISMAYGTKVH